ncbi:trehalose/maltose hydrolase or phosphorylase [Saccharomonospora marina XMU15]|uniref:Trehalose/maltose hydrolase or phosphorylase n=1 Tax=Saccharomonospora marina XMU15 TaxID=882083 RepID=H5X0R3_9PSEU|nr:glycosyl hydrolase family 65 protein [Saccharomonospora marina]EHR50859.1 trehalose/maltose hydrolase or phosphorylase [Saccharomonospora marina XMU15]
MSTSTTDRPTEPGGGYEGCALCAEPTSREQEWLLSYRDDEARDVASREALLTLANGYLGVRGADPEAVADGVHYPGTYVAGVYNRLSSAPHGRPREDESVVNLPNWLPLTFRIPGQPWFGAGYGTLAHQHLVLDLRRGVLLREAVVTDENGRRTTLRQQRLVSMASPHLAALRTELVPRNWSGPLEVRSTIDGRISNGNVAAFAGLSGQHLEQTESGERDAGEVAWLVARTVQSKLRIAQAARTTLRAEPDTRVWPRAVAEPGVVGREFLVEARPDLPVVVEKVVAVHTSRDRAISEPLLAARDTVSGAGSFVELLDAHTEAWKYLWRRFRIGTHDGPDGQLPINFHMFHVLQTLTGHTADLDVGVPARGLHGEGYRGHVFWDELFVFPLLSFRVPRLTRALLGYRHRRLDQARRLAGQHGRRGAMFPWQSGSDGREETPQWFFNPRSGRWMADNSRRQYHVNLAIGYNLWHYWQVTGDLDFLASYGAELLVEIARFWADLVEYDAADDRYDVRAVMGPDEFHDGYPDRPGQGIDNNSYVNVMVAWLLARAVEAHRLLGTEYCGELWDRLDLRDDELAEWDRISRRLRVSFLDNGLLAQFEGYERLSEFDWDHYRARYGELDRLDLILEAENDSCNRYQVAKQADVLMLFYLFTAEELTGLLDRLGYAFDPATIPPTVDFYLARTSHGSTLSRVAHSWVLSRTDRPRSWRLLRDALVHDLSNRGDSTGEGIHLGAMAASADILQRCYTGLEVRQDVLWLNPRLPTELRALDLDLHYRGQWLSVHIDHQEAVLRAVPCAANPIDVGWLGTTTHRLAAGQTLRLPIGRQPQQGENAAGPSVST